MRDKQSIYLQTIHKAYPALRVNRASLNDKEGQYNDILIINDAVIFRFPKFAEGIDTIRQEVRILQCLQGRTTLPTPYPIYQALESVTIGEVFMGYVKLPGEPLWREVLQTVQDGTIRQRLARQLAQFLTELHSIPVAVFGADTPVLDKPEEWTNLYADFREYLFPLMRSDARDWITNHFESYLGDPNLHHYQPCLRHGDFGTGNILYDRENQTICGIIDFGFAGIGDPALDIAAAMSYGEAFFAHYYDVYPITEAVLARAHFYRGTYALSEALYGIKNGDEAALASGIEAYI